MLISANRRFRISLWAVYGLWRKAEFANGIRRDVFVYRHTFCCSWNTPACIFGPDEEDIKIIRWLLILVFLCRRSFISGAASPAESLESALSENTLKRWQPIDFRWWTGQQSPVLFCWSLYCFYFYALRQNKHLIILLFGIFSLFLI